MTDIAPNGLPLVVERYDGTRLEHEYLYAAMDELVKE